MEEWQRWGRHIRADMPECSVVDVLLHGRDIEDRDLPGILAHVEKRFFLGQGWCGYKLCLSRNPGITDFGIVNHLAPFLRHHPHCVILDLSETSIGDAALEALTPWICQSQVAEVHLSELGGTVTRQAVVSLLSKLKHLCRFQFWHPYAVSPLWLRLDRNDILGVEELASQGEKDSHVQV